MPYRYWMMTEEYSYFVIMAFMIILCFDIQMDINWMKISMYDRMVLELITFQLVM